MNVLIIYPFYNQRELMHNFATRLNEQGVHVDVIHYGSFRYDKYSLVEWSKLFLKAISFINTSNFELLNKIIKRCLLWFLPKIFHSYDLIDFHAYYPRYNRLMRKCVVGKKKFDITLWGSDLMRANKERTEFLKYGFDHCYRIKMTSNLYDTMVQYYGNIYGDKYREVYFGCSEVDQIDAIFDNDVDKIRKRFYGETSNKKILVCGYNGSNSQNHNKMIIALNKLSEEEKRLIHVVLPMTYGAQPNYIEEIRDKMKNTGVSFTLLDHFLEAKEVAVIRRTAHIVINVQNTDALSGSLKGHLYCGNVCIFGEWLNYSPFTNNGIYYIKTSMDGLANHLKDVLHNYEKYHGLTLGNHGKIKSLFSWEATIQKQVSVYGE